MSALDTVFESPIAQVASDSDGIDCLVIGSGTAWISTNGRTVKGTWKKTSLTSPTRFYGADGKPVALTIGQTFVQVMKTTDAISFVAGKPAPPPDDTPRRNLPL